jgi:hypothetical protein
MRIESDATDGEEPLTIEEAIIEKEQQEILMPENIYQIEEVDNG